MALDIRIPIGLLFLVLGALLSAYGLVADPAVYERSLGININLAWGLVLALFGAVFLFFGRRARRHVIPAVAAASRNGLD
jgi:multisubunit Na+/H+ antiporter MnhG subunit